MCNCTNLHILLCQLDLSAREGQHPADEVITPLSHGDHVAQRSPVGKTQVWALPKQLVVAPLGKAVKWAKTCAVRLAHTRVRACKCACGCARQLWPCNQRPTYHHALPSTRPRANAQRPMPRENFRLCQGLESDLNIPDSKIRETGPNRRCPMYKRVYMHVCGFAGEQVTSPSPPRCSFPPRKAT